VQTEPSRPDIWLWLATAQEISDQLELEVETLLQALKTHPKNADLLYVLGNAYERLGKQEVAHLARIASASARSEQLLAESYAASNEWPSAVIHFQNALNAAPHVAGLHVELGEVLLRAGKVNPAIKEFDEELRTDSGNLPALVRRGEAKLVQKDVDAALQDWEQAIAIDVDQTERILGIREIGFGDSALEQLPDAFRERIRAFSEDLRGRNTAAARLASAFLAAQNGDLALAEREASLVKPSSTKEAFDRNCTEAGVELALQHGRITEVAKCEAKVLTRQTSAEFRIRVASALLADGEFQSAFDTLYRLPSAERNSAEASYWRARCYERMATAAYLQLYQADPNSYRLHQLMGDLEATKGNDGKAIEEYRAAISLQPSVPNLHYSLGHLLWKDLKVPEARAELDAELAINPGHAGALDDLGDTYLLEHQPDKALPYLVKALAVDSTNPDLQRDLGTAYSELGDYHKAEEHYKIAVLADHDGSVHYKLGKVYQALGEKETAAHEFALSTALNHESHSKLEKQTQRIGEITRSVEVP
jgi:tetratricopeptide (TPR) repeat protein